MLSLSKYKEIIKTRDIKTIKLIPVLEDEKKEIELHKKRFKRLEKAS
jgi:hypothetical protein